MSLYDDLKARVTAAVKAGDAPTRDTLRTVLGEAQMEALRRKSDVTDDVVLGVVKKGVAGLKETIPLAKKDGRDTAAQEAELALLEALLPKAWDRDVITAAPWRCARRGAGGEERRAGDGRGDEGTQGGGSRAGRRQGGRRALRA